MWRKKNKIKIMHGGVDVPERYLPFHEPTLLRSSTRTNYIYITTIRARRDVRVKNEMAHGWRKPVLFDFDNEI